MLNSFSAKRFKVLNNIKIDHFSRLNLFVGSNNAGKSCLLEAIRLWSSNASPSVIRDLVRSHDGDWTGNSARRRAMREDLDDEIESEDPIRFLFNEFHYHDAAFPFIDIGPDDEDTRVRISLGRYRTIKTEDGMIRRVRVDENLFDDDNETNLMLELSVGSKHRNLISLDNLWRRAYPRPGLGLHEDLPMRPLSIVGTTGMGVGQVSILWDRVSLMPEQERVLECLRLVEPAINGLALVVDTYRSNAEDRIPVVSMKGRRGRYPLKSMGDGLTRLFHIALSMVNAQDGIVLIDEFENGLYWGIQEELWSKVFELAENFNVQVFATSHSSDCLGSFVNSCQLRPNLGSLFRLERIGEDVRVRSLPVENASDALASQVEIR